MDSIFRLARCAGFVLLCVCFLASCSLFDPYVDPMDVSMVETIAADRTRGESAATIYPCALDPGDMQDAMNCARAVESAYFGAMGDQAMLSSLGGASLIALTAYTAGIAINDGSTTKVTDFALGTAALVAMSQWLSQPQRAQIYGLGAKALQCAVDVATPFKTAGDLAGVESHLVKLRADMNNTRGKLSELSGHLDAAGKVGGSASALLLVQSTRELLERAETSVKTGTALLKTHKQAPYALVASVHSINASVNLGLNSTVQSLATLPGALSSMLGMYGGLLEDFGGYGYSPAPEDTQEVIEAQSAKSRDDAPSAEIVAKTDALRTAATELQNSLARVEIDIGMLTPKLPEEAAEECGVDLTGVKQAISVNPAELTFGSEDANVLSVQISGGAGSYMYSADESALGIKQVPAFGRSLQVKPKAGAAGRYLITVSDASGNSGVVQVVVDAKAKGSGGDTTPGAEQAECTANKAGGMPGEVTLDKCKGRFPSTVKLSTAEEGLCTDAGKTLILQVTLKGKLPDGDQKTNLCNDGFYGPSTRKALLTFRASGDAPKRKPETDPVAQEDIDAVLAPPE
ncbi:hypothetical protein [Parahalioglobus pacificus]|uniref:Uncharacterized protein n=1 Tax=Parahalioglobus pacificus TaxID=930806 RepID=A0A918XBX4_9GAMM|nr:hypothetical protein [Halioglobus pacificus]GHD25482.1 hypothetical protein GCM10007053_01320 [Halioglobus pacificus]